MNTPTSDRALHSGRYLIRIKGHLPPRWAAHFEAMTLISYDDGTTLIHGTVIDQAALHGLLAQIRDTGLPLLSVTRTEQAPAPEATTKASEPS
jgi:hypothetical protein